MAAAVTHYTKVIWSTSQSPEEPQVTHYLTPQDVKSALGDREVTIGKLKLKGDPLPLVAALEGTRGIKHVESLSLQGALTTFTSEQLESLIKKWGLREVVLKEESSISRDSCTIAISIILSEDAARACIPSGKQCWTYDKVVLSSQKRKKTGRTLVTGEGLTFLTQAMATSSLKLSGIDLSQGVNHAALFQAILNPQIEDLELKKCPHSDQLTADILDFIREYRHLKTITITQHPRAIAAFSKLAGQLAHHGFSSKVSAHQITFTRK